MESRHMPFLTYNTEDIAKKGNLSLPLNIIFFIIPFMSIYVKHGQRTFTSLQFTIIFKFSVFNDFLYINIQDV